MDAVEFISKYPQYLNFIERIVKDELMDIINEMRATDPHDLVTPDSYFSSDSEALGRFLLIFIQKMKKNGKI